MDNFYDDNEDLQFYVEKVIRWQELVKITEYDYQSEDGFKNAEEALDFYKDILNSVGELSAKAIAPIAAELDKQGLKFENGEVVYPESMESLFRKIADMGLHGMCAPREFGGMNSPLILYFLTSELLSRGDSSVMSHFGFHGGIGLALLMYSIMEGSIKYSKNPAKITYSRFQKEIEEIVSGQAWGSMDITEPGAGSDMSAIKTYGEQDKDGNWFVTGEKIWITSGNGKYHIVIAKTEKDTGDDLNSGLKTLSLFLVPAYTEKDGKRVRTVEIGGLEKKLGINVSATCALYFDKSPAQLIGKRGDGFKLMLLIMNNARLSVGFESLGLCENAYRLAKEYAAGRVTMGKTIDKHEMIADYLEEMQTDIQAIRALAVEAAYQEEMAQKLKIKAELFQENSEVIRKQQKRFSLKSRELTPLLKYFSAEKAVEISRKSLQIHGGYGFTTEFGCEKLLRDSVIFPIYEGTSQIQALMVMKDTMLGVIKKPDRFLRKQLEARGKMLFGKSEAERKLGKIQSFAYSSIQTLLTKVVSTKISNLKNVPFQEWVQEFSKNWNPKRDFAPAMLHAENLTQILVDKAICEILYKQAQQFPERKELFDRYIDRAELRVEYTNKKISAKGGRLLEKLEKAG
ncbi:MAG: acyl-CoA dehydrogenase family protein [Spirochaetota bacterium]